MGYEQITLAQFRQDLQDKWESVPFWTDAEANDAINEVLETWNMLTGQWHSKITVSPTQNDPWVTLPGTMTYSMSMIFNGYPMYLGSLLDFDYGQENWEGQTTADSGVPDRPTFWMPAGLNLFAIWPADSVGGNSITVDGVIDTPVLSNDADFVDIGRQEYNALLGEALHIASFKAGSIFLKMTESFHNVFIKAAFEKNTRLKASTLFKRALGLDMNRHTRPDFRLNAQRRSDEDRQRRDQGAEQ